MKARNAAGRAQPPRSSIAAKHSTALQSAAAGLQLISTRGTRPLPPLRRIGPARPSPRPHRTTPKSWTPRIPPRAVLDTLRTEGAGLGRGRPSRRASVVASPHGTRPRRGFMSTTLHHRRRDTLDHRRKRQLHVGAVAGTCPLGRYRRMSRPQGKQEQNGNTTHHRFEPSLFRTREKCYTKYGGRVTPAGSDEASRAGYGKHGNAARGGDRPGTGPGH